MQNRMEIRFIPVGGEPTRITLPSKNIVCPTCQGNGYDLNDSNIQSMLSPDNIKVTASLTHRTHYLEVKVNVTCKTCHGQNVVKEVDESQFDEADKVNYNAFTVFLQANPLPDHFSRS